MERKEATKKGEGSIKQPKKVDTMQAKKSVREHDHRHCNRIVFVPTIDSRLRSAKELFAQSTQIRSAFNDSEGVGSCFGNPKLLQRNNRAS